MQVDQSKERFPAVLVNASVPSLGCKANGGFESCISIHTSGYSVWKSQGREVKEHVGPEFDAAQIEKWMSLHETGWQFTFMELSFSTWRTQPRALQNACNLWPMASDHVCLESNRLHWCCFTPAGMSGRNEASKESDKPNRKVANEM